jgi:thiol-disulfide isomerase/thioredoxin
MKARQIGPDGVWRRGRVEVPLLGADIPVPAEVQRGKDSEVGLGITNANFYLRYCPKCKSEVGPEAIVIILEVARMFPAHCCDHIMWFVEEGETDIVIEERDEDDVENDE